MIESEAIQNSVKHLRWSLLQKYLTDNYFEEKLHLRDI